MASHEIDGLTCSIHQFGPHSRQQVGVWEWKEKRSAGYWIIYIHGGAWRSPVQTFADFTSTVKLLSQNQDPRLASIRGFMSLDYRLSGHKDEATVEHPDHVDDIANGLTLLNEKYNLGNNNYILIGHSAGATLSFQLLMDQISAGTPTPPLPAVIIGISGIYDMVGLNDRFKGTYAGFITDAFGSNQRAWQNASPARFKGDFKKSWVGGRFAVLANSAEDSLVDFPEVDAMQATLERCEVPVHDVRNLTGEHDFIWEDGSQIAAMVADALAKLTTTTTQ